MNPRIRRLLADQQRMTAVFSNHPHIRILQTEGNPAEKYLMEFQVQGLVEGDDGTILQRQAHRAEIFLPLDYPRRQPLCRMTSPVYHPNIDPRKICIGDHWSAGQSLAHLVVRIAEMLAYQSFNIKSPLNAKAAAWAEQNSDRLPLEEVDYSVGL